MGELAGEEIGSVGYIVFVSKSLPFTHVQKRSLNFSDTE